ncbi:MAG: putative minor capsid protein, partial [Clostridium sp.]
MQPIPKKLLIHHVVHAKEVDTDRWGTSEIESRQELKRVRIEPSSKTVRDKNNAEIQLAATLFYDCKNSRPSGISFIQDDAIIFTGQKYKIQTVEPLYDG